MHGADARAELIDMSNKHTYGNNGISDYHNNEHNNNEYHSNEHDSNRGWGNGASPYPSPGPSPSISPAVIKPGSGVTPLSLCHTKNHPHCAELLVAHLHALTYVPRTYIPRTKELSTKDLRTKETILLQEQNTLLQEQEQHGWNHGLACRVSPFTGVVWSGISPGTIAKASAIGTGTATKANITTAATFDTTNTTTTTTSADTVTDTTSPGACVSATLGEQWLSMLWAHLGDEDKGSDNDNDNGKGVDKDKGTDEAKVEVKNNERAKIGQVVVRKVQRWGSQIDRLRYPFNGRDDDCGSDGGSSSGGDGGGKGDKNPAAPSQFERELNEVDLDRSQSTPPVKSDHAQSYLTGGVDRDLIEVDLDRCCFPDYRRYIKPP